MRRNLSIGCFVIAALLLASATGTKGTTVKGRSGYGNSPASDPTLNFGSCSDGSYGACEVFGSTSVGTAIFDGTTSLDIVQFAFNDGTSHVLDVVDLGALASGATFTLTSSLFNPANLEVFSCASPFEPLASDASVLTDSGGLTVPGSSCTPDLVADPLSSSTLTLTNPTTGQFTLSQSVTDLVLDFTPGSTTATPEPASIALLGFGLAAIGTRLRRKTA